MKRIKRRKPASKSKEPFNILDQWIEVTEKDGVVRTELFPPNQELLEEGRKMDPPPLLVYRRLNFPAGVPELYRWTGPDENTMRYGGACVQRMKMETWLTTIERESHQPGGHVGPTGEPAVPRPLERGGCECQVCKANHHILAELGLAT